VIISNSKKYVYIHIPKCGGTTVSTVLSRWLLPQDVSLAVNPHKGWEPFVRMYRDRFGLFKHSTAAEIARAMGPGHFKTYYAFTFCRNPFSRAHSAFTFTKSADAKHRPQSQRYLDIKDMNFEEFLQSKYMQEKKIHQARPQYRWTDSGHGEVQAFHLENLEYELGAIIKKFHGAELNSDKTERRNFSAEKDAWKTMSPQAEHLIRELYRDDFQRFGYPDKIDRENT